MRLGEFVVIFDILKVILFCIFVKVEVIFIIFVLNGLWRFEILVDCTR